MELALKPAYEVMVHRKRVREKIHSHKEIEKACDVTATVLQIVNRVHPPTPTELGSPDNWEWNQEEQSEEVVFCGQDQTEVIFHPHWSSTTAGIRGTRALDSRIFYWELQISQRIFGTSIMFGVATKSARLNADSFVNLLGEDAHGWGLSHKGLLWHDGRWTRYTRPFRENEATTIGLLYNGIAGTLTYYKDGTCLGVAFRNLHRRNSTLYPFISSSTSKTKMKLSSMRRDFTSLQDRCRHVIARRVGTVSQAAILDLPQSLVNYVQQALLSQTNKLFRPASKLSILDM